MSTPMRPSILIVHQTLGRSMAQDFTENGFVVTLKTKALALDELRENNYPIVIVNPDEVNVRVLVDELRKISIGGVLRHRIIAVVTKETDEKRKLWLKSCGVDTTFVPLPGDYPVPPWVRIYVWRGWKTESTISKREISR